MPRIYHERLQSDIKTDVLVIGSGITGALMAEELSATGFAVSIVDRRSPLQGSTLATTALLQYEIDIPLINLSRTLGFDKAARAWRRSKLGVESLVDRTRVLQIPCAMRAEKSIYLAGSVLNAEGLQKELEIRQQIGLQTRLLDAEHLENKFRIQANAGLEAFGDYSANPYRLAAGYLKKSQERGTKIYSPVEIVDIETSPRLAYAHTKSGKTITARHVVFATGYEVPRELSKQNYNIFSTWAFATKPQKDIQGVRIPMICECSDPYLYIRSTTDGRIICGGEDEEFSDEEKRDALTPGKIKKLQTKLQKLFPFLDTHAAYSWSGSFGITPAGLPLIGPVPGLKHCFSVMAFGGNGITSGRIGAEIISGYLTGKDDPDADLFKFTT